MASLSTSAYANNYNVLVKLQAADLSGNPITESYVGGSFLLEAFVQDIRPPQLHAGVYGSWLNVQYSPLLSSIDPAATVTFGSDYENFRQHDLSTPGQIRNTGAFTQSITGVGSSPLLLWSVPVQATAAGLATFTPSLSTEPGY